MKDFIQYLVESIAKHPEDVVIVEKQLDETYIKEEITVHPEDMGLVIGRNGRTIRSIRELAKAKAIKESVKVDVELLEPEGGRKSAEVKEAATAIESETVEVKKTPIEEVEEEIDGMLKDSPSDI